MPEFQMIEAGPTDPAFPTIIQPLTTVNPESPGTTGTATGTHCHHFDQPEQER